jgi:hypothetical protein
MKARDIIMEPLNFPLHHAQGYKYIVTNRTIFHWYYPQRQGTTHIKVRCWKQSVGLHSFMFFRRQLSCTTSSEAETDVKRTVNQLDWNKAILKTWGGGCGERSNTDKLENNLVSLFLPLKLWSTVQVFVTELREEHRLRVSENQGAEGDIGT